MDAIRAIGSILEHKHEFIWLEPPIPNGQMTVVDVAAAQNLAEHKRLVEEWARDVWAAWSAYHNLVRAIVASA